MRRVDAHHHVWDPRVREYPFLAGDGLGPLRRRYDTDELAPLVGAHGIGATVVVQATGSADETRELLALADGSDLVIGVVGWVDVTAPDVADRLAALRAGPGGDRLVGIRHQAEDEPDAWLTRADVTRGIAAVIDAGLVYDLLVSPGQLAAAPRLCRALPAGRFVLDHAAKPDIAGGAWQPWARRIADLAACPNVTVKLSGLVTEADWSAWRVADLLPYARHALDAFGPDRVMFGSDWPVCTLAATYEQVTSAADTIFQDLTAAERAAVLGQNATRVYGLAGRGPVCA